MILQRLVTLSVIRTYEIILIITTMNTSPKNHPTDDSGRFPWDQKIRLDLNISILTSDFQEYTIFCYDLNKDATGASEVPWDNF